MRERECPCCGDTMQEEEVLWSDLYECAIAFWYCPSCGNEEEEILE